MKVYVRPQDLRRETFRAGGKGGQHQNVTESAVRYTHVPTGLSAESRTERSQNQNDKDALSLLFSKLLRWLQDRQASAAAARYAEKPEATFGSQRRTYRDVGERDVVDHLTGTTGTFDAVVRKGRVDPFVRDSLLSHR